MKTARLAPPADRTEAAWLRNTMMLELAPGSAAPTADFATLAAAIRDRCLSDPTVVILDHVDRLRNGLEGFYENFWVPLHHALRDAWAQRPATHRFVLVVMLRSSLPNPPPSFVWSGNGTEAAVNYDRLVSLPKLNKFKKAEVRQYIRNTLNLWGPDKATIDRLADDCVPANVYGRLVDANLVPETGR